MPATPRESLRQVYLNRRMATLLVLGFASGLPLMLTLTAMQAWLVQTHVDIKSIGLFAWVTVPYSFKFLWSPLMDRFVPPGLSGLGRRRAWIIVTQVLLIAAIAGMALASPARSIWMFAVMALLVAFASASQDIVIDAYRTDILPPEELAAGAAMYVNGYRLGMIVSGGGALMLADSLPWRSVYLIMAACLLPGLVAALLAPNPDTRSRAPASLASAIADPFVDFFRRLGWRGVLVLAFILLFKVPEMTANWQFTPFLLEGANFTQRQVGLVQGVLGITVTIVGALAGGALVARWGLIRALWVIGILGTASNAGYMVMAWVGNQPAPVATIALPRGALVITRGLCLLVAVVSIESFCYGLVTAGFVAFLMSQCNKRYSATQYALLSSVMGLTGTLFRAPTGYVFAWLGASWWKFFAVTILAGVPGLVLLCWVREPTPIDETPVQELAGDPPQGAGV